MVSLKVSWPWTALFKLKIVPPEFTVTELSDCSLISALFWVDRLPRVIPEFIVNVDVSENWTCVVVDEFGSTSAP